MLAEMAQTEPLSFRSIVEMSISARKALAASKKPREVNSFAKLNNRPKQNIITKNFQNLLQKNTKLNSKILMKNSKRSLLKKR
jgi:hypothetical protein